jgi:glucose-6-phosphate isomerase
MFPKINPTTTQAWLLLRKHYEEEMQRVQMKALFEKDAERFAKFSLRFEDILFDYSKNIISQKTLQLLLQLADECKLKDAIEAMFTVEKINETEDRSVLHIALRNITNKPIESNGKNVMPLLNRVLEQMKEFCRKIHSGEWKGFTGKPIKYM